MNIHIIPFGKITDFINPGNQFVIYCLSARELRNWLENKYPPLKNTSYKIVINKQIVDDNETLHDSMEIILLPPFSGG